MTRTHARTAPRFHKAGLLSTAAFFAAVTLGAPLLSVGCVAADAEDIDEDVDEVGMTFEEFEAQTYREPETGTYIVDGDIAIPGEDRLRAFYEQHVREGALSVARTGFIFTWDVVWDSAQKVNLTYCVSTTFGSRYNQVVQAMRDAAGAWEGAADVNFIHLTDHDGSCDQNNNNVVFDVRPTSGQSYNARAFFPNFARPDRNILINDSAYWSVNPLVGILRHELGHALGFVHEHIRPEATGTDPRCDSDEWYRPVTGYDSASVMHYQWCGGTGTGYVLTDSDRAGAASIYGNATGQWVRLKTINGHYLIAWDGGGGALMSNSTFPGEWESFKLIPVGDRYALRSFGGKYVAAEWGGGGDVNVNRTAIGAWEKFRLHTLGAGNEVAFQTDNGKFLSALDGGGGAVKAIGDGPLPWETLTIEYQ